MKVKAPFKPKTFKKSQSGSIQKKKFTKPTGTGGALKNIVKITDAFEDLNDGKDLTGISCSKEHKPSKKAAAKAKTKAKTDADDKVPKNTVSVEKKDKKTPVVPKQKKPKKDAVSDASNISLKSNILASCVATKEDGQEPELDIDKVETAVKGLFTLIKNKSTLPKNELWDEPTPIHLVITAVKMGVGPKRLVRIALPNSLITDTTDICLIVPDLVRGRNVDHEKTYHHYKDLLAANNIKNIKTILPARQIRVEFNEYESRRNLCHSHDVFLIDQKISTFMVKKLGKEFYIKRKFPITVKLSKKYLKAELESKLHKTTFFLDYRGSTKTVQIGHMLQTPRQVAENIIATFNNLSHSYPGGLKNIRSLFIKSPTSESLPVYYSLISRNDVIAPYSKSKTYSKDKEVEGELFGKRVLVKPNGDVVVMSGSEEESGFEDDDDDVKVANKTTKQNKSHESDAEEDEVHLTKSTEVKVDKKLSTNKDSESEENSEAESGDDAEAEYLMEFEQTKKLQSKKKLKKENKVSSEIKEPEEIVHKHLKDSINEKKSRKTKSKKVNKVTAKKKKLNS